MEEEEAVLPPEWTLSTSGLILPPMNIQFHFASRLTAYQVTIIIFIITAYQVITIRLPADDYQPHCILNN